MGAWVEILKRRESCVARRDDIGHQIVKGCGRRHISVSVIAHHVRSTFQPDDHKNDKLDAGVLVLPIGVTGLSSYVVVGTRIEVHVELISRLERQSGTNPAAMHSK